MTNEMTRRRFLKDGCLALAVAAVPGGMTLVNVTQALAADKNFQPHAFLEIAPDDSITVWVGQTNLGQGTHTCIAMIIADELDADWRRIGVKMALAADVFKDPVWGVQLTAGSTSIRRRWDLLRSVGAAARLMLIRAAAGKWGVDPAKCSSKESRVIGPDGRSMSYGELVGAASAQPVPEKPSFKERKDYGIMGTYRQRLDMVDKIQGRTEFGLDFKVPDMLIAVMDRPKSYGAKPESYDEKAALAVKGVEKVVRQDDKIAVLATSTYAALKGREALGTKWSKGTLPELSDEYIADLFKSKMEGSGAIKSKGDADKALSESATTIEATYSVPFMAHAQLEPSNCTAFVEKDRCRIWVPIQGQTDSLMAAAEITGLPEDKIELMTTPCGGGFGRRIESDVVAETVSLSKSVSRPVKLMWTREDEFGDDVYRPASVCRTRGGLDAKGNLTALRHKIASPSILSRVQPEAVKNGMDSSSIQGLDDMPYKLDNLLVDYALVDLPMRVGWLRSIAYSNNVFPVESFMDELAYKAGRDPVEFRLSMLEPGSRAYKALSLLAEKSGWNTPAPKGVGRGIAMTECFETVVAHMAEVSVDRSTGAVTVQRIVGVVDSGISVYPDALTAQMEGGAIMGLSMTFNEAMRFANGGAQTENFSGYPILSMTQVPKMEFHLADSGAKAGGIGEPSVPSVPPAVTNAIFAATGVRLRDLPLDTAKLKKG
ncbi:molybdopterin cofactor-binding domain-containing protein [uncultured Pseudodesulfovibrio sp.]|uniref:xanthine dehydrogenase family protein molybdopterin-binding subunit n=1 Tax=uncultured Pseudodesulfovibrio sp. TaxID=2035858 RepID=UPI0029C6F562|nr:molybdopterin cofactor-binding domain-containing protein [uncultured Pseudodesulfovibrio sp.]